MAEMKGVATKVDEEQTVSASDVDVVDESTNNPNNEDTSTKGESNVAEKEAGEKVDRGGILEIETHHEPEEVMERLFSMPDTTSLTKEVSGIWGWVSGESASLVSKAAQIAEKATKQAEIIADKTKTVASAVIKNAEESRKEFDSEQERFMNEAIDPETEQVSIKKDSVYLPWEPKSEYSDDIKKRVTSLSQDTNTFLIPPPEAVDFVFDFDASAPLALAMLEADSELNAKRFKMVPKEVKETLFWRNYFYRVNLIMEAYGKQAYITSSKKAAEEDTDAKQTQSQDEQVADTGSPAGQLHTANGDDCDAKGDALVATDDENDDEGSVDKDGWGDGLDDDLDFDSENFDMLNEELLGEESEVSDVDDDLEARINAELSLMDD